MFLAVAVTLPLQFLLLALLAKAQPKEVASETQRERGHYIDKSIGDQRMNNIYHSPAL